MRFEEILRALADTIEQHGTGAEKVVQEPVAVIEPALDLHMTQVVTHS